MNRPVNFTYSRRLLWAAGILAWMIFYGWVLSSWLGYSLWLAVWDSAVSNIVVLTLSAMISKTISDYVPAMAKFWSVFGLSVLLAFFSQWLSYQALAQLGEEDVAYLQFLHQSAPVRWAIDFLILCGVSVSGVFYFQLQEQQELKQREETTASMVREAELQKLQLQLQPHFLFNCLNSINALIIVQPEEARRMVQRLSDFLRITLKRADEHWVRLEEEWNYLQLYLDIEKVRFGHRLEVVANFSEDSLRWMIPALLLQPLVENAIKFGLYGTTAGVTITLEASVSESLMLIQISNPFDPEMLPPSGSGFGLHGMKRRLYLLFARNDLMETKISNNIFTVVLKIPKRV